MYRESEGRADTTVADGVRSGWHLFVSGFCTGSMMMRLDLDRPGATALRKDGLSPRAAVGTDEPRPTATGRGSIRAMVKKR